jgi:hypothetical protein
MVDEARGIALFVGYLLGWPLKKFRSLIDRLPRKEFSELTPLDKIGRLFLMAAAVVFICAPLAWIIWR